MPSLIDPKLFPKVKEPGQYTKVFNRKFIILHLLEFVEEMLHEGKDPKDRLIQYCTPHCTYWKDKLSRCEKKLE